MLQAGQDNAQTHIALFKIGNGGHHLLIGGVVAGLVQLTGQICQLLGVGGVVTIYFIRAVSSSMGVCSHWEGQLPQLPWQSWSW